MSTQDAPPLSSPLDLVHLRRDARTSLELGIVGLAPTAILEGLATASGLLEAISELPADAPPVKAMLPQVVQRTRLALAAWNAWHVGRLGRG
jgi:hypothetical protein